MYAPVRAVVNALSLPQVVVAAQAGVKSSTHPNVLLALCADDNDAARDCMAYLYWVNVPRLAHMTTVYKMSGIDIQVFDCLDYTHEVDGVPTLQFQSVRCNYPCAYEWIDQHGNITDVDRLVPPDRVYAAINAHNKLYHA